MPYSRGQSITCPYWMGQRGQTTGFMFPTPRQAIPIPLDTIYENQQTAELEVRLASRSSLQIHPNVMWADVVKDIRFTNAADFSLSNPDSCQETMTCCYYGDTGYQSHMPYNTHLQKNRRNAHLDSLFTSKVRRWVRNISSHRNDSVNQAQCSCHLWSKGLWPPGQVTSRLGLALHPASTQRASLGNNMNITESCKFCKGWQGRNLAKYRMAEMYQAIQKDHRWKPPHWGGKRSPMLWLIGWHHSIFYKEQ